MRGLGLKNKLVFLMSVMAFVFAGYTNAEAVDYDFGEVDSEHYVYDFADEYSDSEEKELQKLCEKVGKKLGLDIIIVTTDDLGQGQGYASDSVIDRYEREYAEAFYLNGGFGDGILYLLDIDYDGIYVTRSGLAEVYIDDDDHEEILDAIWDDFLDYCYYDAAESFVDAVEDIVAPRLKDDEFVELKDAWVDGGYVYYDEFFNDYTDEIIEAHEEHFFTPFKNPLLCIGVGAVIGLIVVIIAVCSSGTKSAVNKRTYLKDGSFKVLQQYDRYTHTTTHSYKVNSSSGGGSGGRSSSHRSGGRSFSGGGRRR